MPDFDVVELSASDDPAPRATVRDIVDEVERHDGFAPVNEEELIRLDGSAAGSRVVLARDGQGFALATDGELAVAVRPASRGQGLGRALATAAMATDPDRPWFAWAHGDLPAARRLLTGLGFQPERALLRMGRELDGPGAAAARPAQPPEVVIRAFRVGEDEERFLAANRAAFADHPEQGRLDLAGLRARMALPWFDPHGLLLAEEDGHVLGFHWTKVVSPGVGEVYVLGLVPEARGRGLAGVLLWAGLDHLQQAGATQVELYVDDDNLPAVALYEGHGFTILDRDVRFAGNFQERIP